MTRKIAAAMLTQRTARYGIVRDSTTMTIGISMTTAASTHIH